MKIPSIVLFSMLLMLSALGCETGGLAVDRAPADAISSQTTETSTEADEEAVGGLDVKEDDVVNDDVVNEDLAQQDKEPNVEPQPSAASTPPAAPSEFNPLTEFEQHVILHRGTERAFVGEYTDTEDAGTYICRRCNAPLYKSDMKFHSGCGWPSFDDEIDGAVDRFPDADGMRVEIVCHNCGGHLGHVFEGERLTKKNTRHCVNSVSMKLIPDGKPLPPVVQKPADKEPAAEEPAAEEPARRDLKE